MNDAIAGDRGVQRHITELADEEHALERGLAVALQPDRLKAITSELDQYWDLLRQRRARTAADLDVGDAQIRSASVVTGYMQ